MKMPEDIRLLLLFFAGMGIIAGIVTVAIIAAPVISSSPDAALRLITAILFAFVTLKFFLYLFEAAVVLIGEERHRRIKSAHPMLRRAFLVAAAVAVFLGWYLLIDHLRSVF